jgi:hypothetical protein
MSEATDDILYSHGRKLADRLRNEFHPDSVGNNGVDIIHHYNGTRAKIGQCIDWGHAPQALIDYENNQRLLSRDVNLLLALSMYDDKRATRREALSGPEHRIYLLLSHEEAIYDTLLDVGQKTQSLLDGFEMRDIIDRHGMPDATHTNIDRFTRNPRLNSGHKSARELALEFTDDGMRNSIERADKDMELLKRQVDVLAQRLNERDLQPGEGEAHRHELLETRQFIERALIPAIEQHMQAMTGTLKALETHLDPKRLAPTMKEPPRAMPAPSSPRKNEVPAMDSPHSKFISARDPETGVVDFCAAMALRQQRKIDDTDKSR